MNDVIIAFGKILCKENKALEINEAMYRGSLSLCKSSISMGCVTFLIIKLFFFKVC